VVIVLATVVVGILVIVLYNILGDVNGNTFRRRVENKTSMTSASVKKKQYRFPNFLENNYSLPNRHKNPSQHPNILYLLADDLGSGDVEYNGGKARHQISTKWPEDQTVSS